MIRKIIDQDIIRLAEIIVYNNRINYYPIFQDYNVLSVSQQFYQDFMQNTYVYIDTLQANHLWILDKNERAIILSKTWI